LLRAPRYPAKNSTAAWRRFSRAFGTVSAGQETIPLRFHCVVIEGVFESALVGGVIFRAATELDENAIVEVQEQVRRRLLHSLVRRAACSRPTTRAT
jgi:hypothetical protein